MSYARCSDVEVLPVEKGAVDVPHRHRALKRLPLCLGVCHGPSKLSVLAQLLGRRLERLSRFIVHDSTRLDSRNGVEGSVDEAVCRRRADEACADEEGVSWVAAAFWDFYRNLVLCCLFLFFDEMVRRRRFDKTKFQSAVCDPTCLLVSLLTASSNFAGRFV